MLESFLTSSADLATVGLIVGVSAVGIVSFSVLKFAPQFQGAIDSFGETNNEEFNRNYQPLTQVFYKFDHANSEQWFNWILCQEKMIQDLAFNKISDYLKEPMDELGAITEEAVTAIVRFKRTESYYVLLELIRSSIRRWGQFKSINLFFETAAKGMVKLNEDNAFANLKEYIDLIIEQGGGNAEVLQISMIRAIATIENPRAEIVDYYSKLVLNRDCSYNFRKEVLEQIHKLANDLDKYNVYLDVLAGFLEATVLKFNDQDKKIIEDLFMHLQIYIEENKPEIWDLLVQCCQKDSTSEILIEPLTDYLRYPTNIISADQIASLLLISETEILNQIKIALALRFDFSEEEAKLIVSKFLKEDLEFEMKVVSSEKSKKTKNVPEILLDKYYKLENILTNYVSQLSKNEQRGAKGIVTILGNAEDEKLYLLRTLAANLNYSFIYIDLASLVNSNYDLTELKNRINNIKPSLIYLAALEDFLLRDFSEDQKVYSKKFIDLITEMSRSPSVKAVASLSEEKNAVSINEKLMKIIEKGSKGRFDLTISIDRPDKEIRRDLISKQIEVIKINRIYEEFDIEKLVSILDNASTIETLKFLNDYFRSSLLIQGKLLTIDDFISFQQTGKLKISSDKLEAEVIE